MLAVLDALPDAAFVKDTAGRYLACNAAFAALCGRPAAQVRGRTDEELFAAGPADRLREADRRAIEQGAPWTQEVWVVHADGHGLLLELLTSPMRGHGGMPIGSLTIARDVTRHDAGRRRLLRSELELLRAQQVAGVGSWGMDVASGELEWSAEARRLFGVSDTEPVTVEGFLARLHPDDRQRVVAWYEAGQIGVSEIEHRIVVDGQMRWIRAQGQYEHGADGKPVRASGTVLDITQGKLYEELLEAEQTRLGDAFEAARAASWERDLVTDRIHVDARWERLLGYDANHRTRVTSAIWDAWLHPDDAPAVHQAWSQLLDGRTERYEAEYRIRAHDGRWVWLRDLGRIMERDASGRARMARGLVIDISGQKAQQEQLDFVADHDGLTGLYRRQRFAEQLREELTVSRERGRGLALVGLDLDGFEAINHAHGRAAGNQLLVEVANRLLAFTGDRRHVGRIGGDEFAVIIPDLEEAGGWRARVAALSHELARPVMIQNRELMTTASMGVTLLPQPREVDAEQLLRQVDQAAYRAKLTGKAHHELFDVALEERRRQLHEGIEEVRSALMEGRFVLHYQPQVNMRTGEILGFEALIRWQHESRGLVLPDDFIPLLAGHPLGIELGDWVIETAIAQLAAWSAEGFTTSVGVNVDAVQLHHPAFFDRLGRQLGARPTVAASRLVVEIVETSALEDPERVSALVARLQAFGIAVALDDFGTGYASLTFLKQLAADVIKIDRSFVVDVLTDPEQAVIVESIVRLGRNLGRKVLAEGVETEAQGQLLVELGCELAQGYGIARPMPADEVIAWAAEWRPPAAWAPSGVPPASRWSRPDRDDARGRRRGIAGRRRSD